MLKTQKSIVIAMLIGSLYTPTVYAATAYYQPTPYPSNIVNGVHVWDGWLGSFYNTTFTKDDRLRIGGWGDIYRTYTKFDSKGLPANVSQAVLWLMPSSLTNPTSVNFNSVTSNWSTGMTWGTQPTATLLGSRAAPVLNSWWGTIITPWYNNWAANPATNYGFRLDPVSTNNNFDEFRSSRYAADGVRPILQLDFTPPVTVPNFKMPLPGNLAWLVTTEVGGWDCVGNPQDVFHDGNNYFSIDFSWRNRNSTGGQVYGDPNLNPNINIPIIAAAGGKVAVIGNDQNAPNGYFVVVDHDGDGSINTGFTTRYIHLKYSPSVTLGQTVGQGDLLGYMGNTPTDAKMGVHLHFGVRYNDNGTATSNGQYVIDEGWILKSFQTECAAGSPIRYYTSSNRVY